ncbi:hypothetical protein FF2_006589 [Malus domestica]
MKSVGVTRLKYHLSGLDPRNNVQRCDNVPPEVKAFITILLKNKKQHKEKITHGMENIGYEEKSLAKRLTVMMMMMRTNVMMIWDLKNDAVSNKHYVASNSQHGKENTFIKFLIEHKVPGQVVVHK